MSVVWRLSEVVGLVDDEGHPAVPWEALRADDDPAGGQRWSEIASARWGGVHDAVSARANFEYLERTIGAVVQRVVNDARGWRSLIVRTEDVWRLPGGPDVLEPGYVVSEDEELALTRRLLRERVELVEGPEAAEVIACALRRHEPADPSGGLDVRSDNVTACYLLLSGEVDPLPVVTALGAEFPGHEVVLDELVSVVTRTPALVTSTEPRAGAASWEVYEKWLGMR